MRHATALVITAALAGAAILLTSRSAAAEADAGMIHSLASVGILERLVWTPAVGERRMNPTTCGERRTGGGGGGGGRAAAAAGMAGMTMAGHGHAEQARAAADRDTAIAQDARRTLHGDPQSHARIGRDGRVRNRS